MNRTTINMFRFLPLLFFLIFSGKLHAADPTPTAPSGSGTLGAPYLIANVNNLFWLTQNSSSWGSYFTQTASIDISESNTWNSNAGFTPIGNAGTKFTGTYDGGNYTITGLYINRTGDYTGMFGYVNLGTVKNLVLSGASVTVSSSVDGKSAILIGYGDKPTIDNVTISGGSITANGTRPYVGALAGWLFGAGGSITNCKSSANVTCTVADDVGLVGGLLGNVSGKTITDCSSSGNVTATSGGRIGGFVGSIDGSTVSKCYARGDVSAKKEAGGFAGYTSTVSISDCYASGNVSIGSSDNTAGGFIGYDPSSTTVARCYAVGSISGGSWKGGFVGRTVSGSSYTVSYWNTDIFTSPGAGNGTASPSLEGHTTSWMKTESNYSVAGWNFSTTWELLSGNYPRLQSNPDGTLPVELSSFTVSTDKNSVVLRWNTVSETNNYGFEVEKNASLAQREWVRIGFVEGNGTTNAPKSYSFTDISAKGKTSYRLKQIDRDGKFDYSQTIDVTAASEPTMFALEQNYPNPFNPATAIGYRLSVAGHTMLKIYDALGREAATLVDEVKDAGNYSAQFDGSTLSSGMNFARLTSSGNSQVRKLLLTK
jgi:hypothetical protein